MSQRCTLYSTLLSRQQLVEAFMIQNLELQTSYSSISLCSRASPHLPVYRCYIIVML